MHVVATAGHVDHGKSTLVRALTGMEPDRWEEERRRGLTIDLGFAWTTLPSGRDVAFVDVPGHERFLGNMLAGLGPAPVVLFVVAADEGWRAQSGDHRDAVEALGIDAGVVVLSRADLAPVGRVAEVLAQVREELAGTGLRDAPAVVASGTTGAGLDALRSTLDEVLGRQPAPPESARVRLWVDRAFTVTGAGTVVTGTLPAGSIASGDALELLGPGSAGAGFPWSRRDIDHDNLTPAAGRTVVVRGLQSEGRALPVARPVSRVALNLRGIPAADVRRGDALVSPGAWRSTSLVDIRRVSGPPLDTVPERLGVHVGTAAVRARVRPLGVDHARLTLARPLPLTPGDRLVLRDPGSGLVAGGQVLDVEPPAFRR
ncbi:selenocysteine-specific translation elongation factor, partial [Nostocoides japonicum]|uniref:selenocysteine-specific translation elongation factor n=1 Tax=Nostocoides japonicum TaxID=99481 RepID=UPI00065BA724